MAISSVQSEFFEIQTEWRPPAPYKVSANKKAADAALLRNIGRFGHIEISDFFVVHSKRENPLLFCQKWDPFSTSTEMIPGCRP